MLEAYLFIGDTIYRAVSSGLSTPLKLPFYQTYLSFMNN